MRAIQAGNARLLFTLGSVIRLRPRLCRDLDVSGRREIAKGCQMQLSLPSKLIA